MSTSGYSGAGAFTQTGGSNAVGYLSIGYISAATSSAAARSKSTAAALPTRGVFNANAAVRAC